MVNCAQLARLAVPIAFAMAAISCRPITAPPGVDRGMASSIPADTLLLAGFSLDEIRASPLYSRIPPAVRAIAEPLRDAGCVLLASNGKELFSIVRGRFRDAPAGAALIARGLAVAGPPESIRAATQQHKTGRSGAPDLLAHAASVAAGKQIWVVARGGVTLPFAGNAANLNRLLRNLEYATIAIALGSRVEVEASAIGRTAEAGRECEENLRAILSLAAAANARQPDLVALIHSIRISREDRTVRATLSGGPEVAERLFRLVPSAP